MREIPTSTGDATIVADGHVEAGLGHLSRSTAIAVALRCRGIEAACFAYGAEGPIRRDGISWARLDGSDIPRGRVLVVDSYRLPADELSALARGMPLVLLHDFGEPPPEAALVVAPAADGIDSGGRQLSGFEYVALRPMFWGLPRRELRGRVERVLVTMGGGSLEAVAHDLAGRLAGAVPDARIALVRGPHGKLDPPVGVELIDSPDSLLEPLLAADVAVTAGGQTMLEAAATGTPCVAVPLVDNQARQAHRLADAAAVRLAPATAGDASAAARAVVELAADPTARTTLSRKAQQAVDGYGALRVAFQIAQLMESRR